LVGKSSGGKCDARSLTTSYLPGPWKEDVDKKEKKDEGKGRGKKHSKKCSYGREKKYKRVRDISE